MRLNMATLNLRSRGQCGFLISVTVASLAIITPVQAEVRFVPHVTGNYEYNSNIFLLSDESNAQVGADGVKSLSDRYWNYGGGINVVGGWGATKLEINTDIKHYSYDHFSQLNRNDKLLGLALDWVATSSVSGITTARYDELLTPFSELDASALSSSATISAVTFSEIDRNVDTTVNYKMNSLWQFSVGGGYGRRTIPLREATTSGSVSYDLEQVSRKAGVRYGGTDKLRLGATIDVNDGRYSSDVTAPDFSIRRYEAQLDYVFSERTSFNATLGRSKYIQPGLDTSSNTGSMSFTQALTAKTSYYVRYDRAYAAYPLTGGSQLGSTTSAGASWQALRKLSLSASYGVTKADVSDGLLGPGVFSTAHKDKLRYTSVTLNYDMLSWLTVTPYYRYQKRTSNDVRYEFDNKVYGASVTLRYE
jgi:hypothetical protein